MIAAAMCLWLLGAPQPLVCLDAQACQVRAAITNNMERRPVASCRPRQA